MVLLSTKSYIYQGYPWHSTVLNEVKIFLTGVDFIKYFVFWGCVFLSTVVGLLIYDKYGPGNFRNLLLGKYFHPRIEERIFMFLDIRSSTAIAEKLGNQQYFRFIHDFINDANRTYFIYKRRNL